MEETILLVDDSVTLRSILAKLLAKEGYRLVEAASGAEALDHAAKSPPDMVLLDVLMPGMDGFQVCSALKANPALEDVPVLFISGVNESAERIRGLELGAVDYLTKPFDRGEVLVKVRAQLKIRQLTKSLKDANAVLLKKQRQIERDLKAAADIQMCLIPRTPPRMPGVDIAWTFLPCDKIGGDVFNIQRLDERHWSIYMIDVSGHGVPSAMVTVAVSQSMSTHNLEICKRQKTTPPYYEIRPPAGVLEALNVEYPMERFDKYLTMTYVVLDAVDWSIRYSNAGHPPPILVHSDGSTELLEEGGSVIGFQLPVPFEEGGRRIVKGDRLYLYTDGIIDASADGVECFGIDRLRAALADSRNMPLAQACNAVAATVFACGGTAELADDITLLGFDFSRIPPRGEPSRDGGEPIAEEPACR